MKLIDRFKACTQFEKNLLISNILLLVICVYLLKYESPEHQKMDALVSLGSFTKQETIPVNHHLMNYINSQISEKEGHPVDVNWAGIEYNEPLVAFRTHATTTDTKRYIVELLLAPTEDQRSRVFFSSVTDVSDKLTKPGF